jgi:small subunit ribosomal protein S4e
MIKKEQIRCRKELNKMVRNHLKRLAVPKTWAIKKKENKWIKRPNPGAHSIEMGLPLSVLITSLLKVANTSKEVTRMLYHKELFVDMKPRKDRGFSVGLFDTINMPKIKKNYRVIINGSKKLSLVEIDEKENNLKLTRVIGKKLISGKTQLNCMDSRNLLVDKDEYKVGDSLLIDLPGQNIKQHFKLEKGCIILLTGGKHMGDYGKLEGIEGKNIIYNSSKGTFQTLKKYAFAVGKEKPAIKVFEK